VGEADDLVITLGDQHECARPDNRVSNEVVGVPLVEPFLNGLPTQDIRIVFGPRGVGDILDCVDIVGGRFTYCHMLTKTYAELTFFLSVVRFGTIHLEFR